MIKILCVLMFSYPLMTSANDFCQRMASNANAKGVRFDNTDNVYRVGGSGRLQFYSAPDGRCVEKDVFVVPGNELYAYVEYGKYYSVMYVANDGNQANGWVEKERLIESHTGIAPDYDANK
ncbi:hypothetical protein ABEH22_13525 [Pantoea agglomerans]|jgi:hypothetical protein|uniref:SH3 domain-containing protein n=1 Tax=[Curtobacterium] plantarum TaxID=221276 RepID=A0ABT9T512_9GAMM|nr:MULTISPECIES: hypothetical protein [Pantoea]AZI50764.1 hypothetical protein CBF16_07815 [Pantoea agglomerans]MDQ0018555.1 hypothetical protein [[Curtobacterium] plantarum]RNA79348.1 hypothetical protein EBO33_04835 [[Curtobacterium] plantarum]UVV71421.1 hypothetical protein NYF24_11210 [Pantoea agglomerans]WRO88802.1 hypothetical protein U9K49_11125 [Pantoea agglomerans]